MSAVLERAACAALLGVGLPLAAAFAQTADPDLALWSLHAQTTFIYQGDFGFRSPYQGADSLSGNGQWRETISGTAFLGRRLPWSGGAVYFDPEFDQGSGLSRTEGVDGFPNGEAAKAGSDTPKPNVARLFLRQVFGLGGPQETIADDENQLAGREDVARITLTIGKFAVPDLFDDNQYAHDSRTQFLNIGPSESLAWDYPADAKGYTDGAAIELNEARWALRGGWFLEPKIANERDLDPRFLKRYGTVVELETRDSPWGRPGKQRFLVFANRTPQGSYDQAVALAAATGAPADIAAVRRDRWKVGFAINLEQAISDDLGAFTRLSWNDGRSEGWAYTDVDRSATAGLSLKGAAWRRPQDTVGLAVVANMLSKAARNFFAAGGTGILTGDGRLDYGAEGILESYYSLGLARALSLTFDYQFVADPAFNQDRGPVSIFAMRVHAEF